MEDIFIKTLKGKTLQTIEREKGNRQAGQEERERLFHTLSLSMTPIR